MFGMPGTCFRGFAFSAKKREKHVESQAHQRAVRAAAEAKDEESAIRIKIRRLDTQALEAEAQSFVSSLTGELPTKRPLAPRTIVTHDETLREREVWEQFEMDGLEHGDDIGCDDDDEEEAIDAALRRLQTMSLGAVGPTESSPFYDDGDETITNIMRKLGNTSARYSQLFSLLRATAGPSDDDMKQSFRANANTSSSTRVDPEWFPYPSKTVR